MTGPARLSCRSGIARSGASRSGAVLSATDALPSWHEGGAVRANPWTLDDRTRDDGDPDETSDSWTLDP